MKSPAEPKQAPIYRALKRAFDICMSALLMLILWPLGAALAKNGVPFEMHIFPHGPHGLGLAENAPDVAQWTGLCRRWLRGLGYAQQLQTK